MADALPFRMSLVDWQAELERRNGGSIVSSMGLAGALEGPDIAFRCPRCGTTCTLQQARDASGNAELAPQQCLHRMLDDGECDWCAGGLFGTLNEGHILTVPDGTPDGHEARVFSFDDEPTGSQAG